PDFYDANYTTNGSAANMYSLSLMASGSYNVNSTTPPYFNAEELNEIGWLSAIPELSDAGNYTLPAVNYPGATQYSAYKTKTSVNNEYFVYECRRGQRWDAGIPTGMLVYHVDKSTNRVSGSITAASTWSSNSVNNYSAHPCCYVVPAAKPTQTTVYSGTSYMFGSGSYKTYQPTAWNGNTTGFSFTNITYANNVVTFTLANGNMLGISGAVFNTDGNPIEGVTISISEGSGVSSAPAKSSIKKTLSTLAAKTRMLLRPSKARAKAIAKASAQTVTTDANGAYTVELAAGTYQIMASKDGYVSQTATVTVTSMLETQNFYLLRDGETLPEEIYAWPSELTEEDEYIVGSGVSSLTAQNLYPVSEMARYAGKQIKEITFFLYGQESTTYSGVNVIIDYDDERKATVAVSSDALTIGGYTTVDLREQELVVPGNKDIYSGVGFSSGGYSETSDGTTYYYAFGGWYKTDENEEYYEWATTWPYDGLVSEYNLTSTGERYSWDMLFDF
ncbi:MAG: carboxypeptidase regulatory-like domain-containing protein, partial [Bacteroidales bacterium]|nr:carboxypeptidase regulatory-like domain-containing protein [Bacteroidales bacterium]